MDKIFGQLGITNIFTFRVIERFLGPGAGVRYFRMRDLSGQISAITGEDIDRVYMDAVYKSAESTLQPIEILQNRLNHLLEGNDV